MYPLVIKNESFKHKTVPSSTKFNLVQAVGCPYDGKQVMERSDEDFYLFFLLFRAFHSPSWVAKLPKSSLTFFFLSESLKGRTSRQLEAFTNGSILEKHFGSLPHGSWCYPYLSMTSLSFSLARKRVSFLISLRAPLNSFLYLCFSRSLSLSSLLLPRFFP